MKLHLAIPALLSALASTLAFADPQVTHFTAEYTMSRGNITIGEVERSLRSAGNGKLSFTSDMHATGFVASFVKDEVSERSLLSYAGTQLKPDSYTYNKSGGKKSRHLNLSFDWAKGLVQNTVAGKEWELPLVEGAQDKLSYQLAIMNDLQRGATELVYPIADKNKFKTYRFKVAGKETLETAMGSLETVRVERIVETDGKSTTLWCAPSLNYLPVRIEQNEKGDEYSMAIRSVSGLAESALANKE